MDHAEKQIDGYTLWYTNEYTVKTCKNGEWVEERWLKDGILNRKDAPSIIKYCNGQIVEKHFYYFGVLYFLERFSESKTLTN